MTKITVKRKIFEKSPVFGVLFNRHFVELSRLITTHFEGDLHLYLILAAITNNSIADIIDSHHGDNEYMTNTVINETYRYIKLLTLSDIVGLPRTTVRRKVERLILLGFIEYTEGAGYRIKKGKMAGDANVSLILNAEHDIIIRLFNEMLRRDMLIVTSDHRGDGRQRGRVPD